MEVRWEAKRYSNPVKLLGEGTYGKVFLCVEHTKDGQAERYVAIKAFKPQESRDQAQALALREARLLAACRGHQNVVALHHAYCTRSGQVYLVQEFIENSLVDQLRVHRPKGLPHGLVCSVIKQLLQALVHMHSKRVVHRDIKIQNVLLKDDGCVKLCDFGMAASLGPCGGETSAAGSHSKPTALTTYVITRWYRAPEVLLQEPYNEKVDVWSVGCLFAELLFNRPLFPGRSHIDQLALVAAGTAAILPQHHTSLRSMYMAHGVNLPSIEPPGGSQSPQKSQLQQQAVLYVRMSEMLLPAMKDFMAAALHPDPAQRASAAQLLTLPIMADAPVVPPTPLPHTLAPPAEALAALTSGKGWQEQLSGGSSRPTTADRAQAAVVDATHANGHGGSKQWVPAAVELATAAAAVREAAATGGHCATEAGDGEEEERGDEGWSSAESSSVPGFKGTHTGVGSGAGSGGMQRGGPHSEPRKTRSFIDASSSAATTAQRHTNVVALGRALMGVGGGVPARRTSATRLSGSQLPVDHNTEGGSGAQAGYGSGQLGHTVPRRTTSSSHITMHGLDTSILAPQASGGSGSHGQNAALLQSRASNPLRRSSVRWADDGAAAAVSAAGGLTSGSLASVAPFTGPGSASGHASHMCGSHTGGAGEERAGHMMSIPHVGGGPPALVHHHYDSSPSAAPGTSVLYRTSSRLSTSSLSTDMFGPGASHPLPPGHDHSGLNSSSHGGLTSARTVVRHASALSLAGHHAAGQPTLPHASLLNSATDLAVQRSSNSSQSQHTYQLPGNNVYTGSPAIHMYAHGHVPHGLHGTASVSQGQLLKGAPELEAARGRLVSRAGGHSMLTSMDRFDRDQMRAWSMPRNVHGGTFSGNGAASHDGSVGAEGFSDSGEEGAGYLGGDGCVPPVAEMGSEVEEETTGEVWGMGGPHGGQRAGGVAATGCAVRERTYLSLPPLLARRAKSMSSSQWAAVRGGMSTRQGEALGASHADS